MLCLVALQRLLRGRGRGATGWILPSLTLEQVLPVAILGCCVGTVRAGPAQAGCAHATLSSGSEQA